MYPKLVREIKQTLDDHKVEEIELLNLKGISSYTDYYLIGTVTNERQLLSMKDYIEEAAIKAKGELIRMDGNGDSGWMVFDCGDVIVHLFLKAIREEINLPGLIQKITNKK